MTSQQVIVHNLPRYPTPFFGRNDEIDEMIGILTDPAYCLLTLVGPGGSGKTRLAIHLASQMVSTFADGTFFVPLTAVTSHSTILYTVANIIGLQFYENTPLEQQIFDYLQDKQMLLVLDSFEHLLGEIDLISQLLRAAPDIKLLITSREALRLQEERMRFIGGMSFPRGKLIRRIDEYGALALFQDRARRVDTDFSVSDTLMQAIQICQLVEGLPLAIELATSWLRSLTCEDIVREISQRFDFLKSNMRDAPTRHQSMRVVFDESWGLLADEEKAVFSKLSVFRGGFTREAAEVIADTSLQTLASLVDKSLVQRRSSGQYEIHELLRQYAAEQLEKLGATEETRDAFYRYYMTFAGQLLADIKGKRQLPAMKEINANFGNIREAWKVAVERKMDEALRPALETLVVFFWDRYKGRVFEFDEMLNVAQQQYDDERSNPHSLWWLLCARSVDYNAHSTAKLELEACLQIAAQNQDQKEMAFCLSELGELMCHTENYAAAVGYFEQALIHYCALGDRYDVARALFNIANWKWYLGEHEQVGQAIQESLVLRREIGDRIGVAWSLGLLASDKILIGDYAAAERIFQDMNAIHHEYGNIGAEAVGKSWLGLEIYVMRGNLELARSLAQEIVDIAPDDNYPLASGYALVTLSVIASLEEDYVKAHNLCLKAKAIDSWPDMLEMVNWALSIAACGSGDYAAARQYIQSTFNYATTIASPAWVTWCLPVMALILAHGGKPEQSLELLALAFTHPASATGWIAKWPLVARLRDDLQTKLGEGVFRAAWDRGKSSNLDEVTGTLRGYFLDAAQSSQLRPTLTSISVEAANRALVDPLTKRELEILQLKDTGLSNPEIAEHLQVSESTIKKHINHIYSKLGVKTRAEALARAHQLGLL